MAMETISLHGPGMFSRWAHGVAFETGRPEVDQLDPGVMDVTWRRQHGWLSGPRLLCLASMKIIENPRWSDILIHYYPLLSTIIENPLWSTTYPHDLPWKTCFVGRGFPKAKWLNSTFSGFRSQWITEAFHQAAPSPCECEAYLMWMKNLKIH